jgi:hypothetical protein
VRITRFVSTYVEFLSRRRMLLTLCCENIMLCALNGELKILRSALRQQCR